MSLHYDDKAILYRVCFEECQCDHPTLTHRINGKILSAGGAGAMSQRVDKFSRNGRDDL
jgi:hypothetical protein